MRKIAWMSLLALLVVPALGAQSHENVGAPEGPPPPAGPAGPLWDAPSAVLYDNGPLVTHPGGGAGGADESRLQSTSLGMNTLGFGDQVLNGNWVADDFQITAAYGWILDSATFFHYQTGSTTTSTITSVVWRIYNGQPGAGGTMIFNGSGLVSSLFTNIYRTSETTVGATNRPIMASTVDLGGIVLAPGTYWLAWQADGTLASGPWAPPVTILGQTTTGNGLQDLANAGTWGPANDSGTLTQQGFPFILEGEIVQVSVLEIPTLGIAGLAALALLLGAASLLFLRRRTA